MKKVSIIIPVYNAEKYLEKCLYSCIAQTYPAIEILLINDGSTDTSGDLCDQFCAMDDRVSVVHKENAGVSIARNAGIEKATGDYITFLDSDDWLEQDAIGRLMKNAANMDFVIAGMTRYDAKGEKVLSVNNPQGLKCVTQKQAVSALFDWKNFFNYRGPCAKLYRRDVLVNNHVFFNPKLTFGEDTCFVLQYMEHIQYSIQLDCSVYNYRICNNTDKNKRYQTEDVDYQWDNGYVLYDARVKLFKHTGLYKELRNKVDALYIERIRFFMNICVANYCDKKKILKKLNMIDKECDIKRIKIKWVSHPLDKIILFCCKYKLYRELYGLFVMKIKIYNRLVR
ncbi:MAG: glycosyltransferase [Bacteroides sp.]|nr:glycosyltransferase [Bacteroides sp.]